MILIIEMQFVQFFFKRFLIDKIIIYEYRGF